ncbi:MAG: hypothetical protein JXR83_01725, partial [Deltaproteobacteria bacterium]|nr:hypothetical protein [Deltaproteobacteria bacterium]
VFDLPVALQPAASSVLVEAEVVFAGGARETLSVPVALPRQDARLRVAHIPGTVSGAAMQGPGGLQLSVTFPDQLRHLVTSVRYLVYPAAGGEPESLRVDAGWFASDPTAAGRVDPGRTISKDPHLKLVLSRRPEGSIGWAEAEVMLAGRLAVTVPIAVGSSRQ